jgi:thiopeptide-type bacteriocin biosynthesis protein
MDAPPTGCGWLSAHLTPASGDLDAVLVDCVRPLVDDPVCRSHVGRYFFVQQSADGRHVRLRLWGAPSSLAELVVPRLERTAAAFRRFESDVPVVTYVPYEPELARYGGAAGLVVAEDHFCFSSALSLRIVEATMGMRSSRFAYSLCCMWAALRELGLSDATRIAFCEQYRQRALRADRGAGPPPEADAAIPDLPLTQVGLSGVDQAVVVEWADRIRLDIARLRSLEGRLSTPVLAIVTSFVHMFNNRLGLSLRHEAQVAALLARAAHRPARGVSGAQNDAIA